MSRAGVRSYSSKVHPIFSQTRARVKACGGEPEPPQRYSAVARPVSFPGRPGPP